MSTEDHETPDDDPNRDDLIEDLIERVGMAGELDGPQIEALASGLLALFDEPGTADRFVARCAAKENAVAGLVCRALAELAEQPLADRASAVASELGASVEFPEAYEQIGASELVGAWLVQAPFGRSVVLGFTCGADATRDHSLLAEVSDDGRLDDLQLAGPASDWIGASTEESSRIEIEELQVDEAVAQIVAAWHASADGPVEGPGVAANQAFARRRLERATGTRPPLLSTSGAGADARRGLSDVEYAQANSAARSTLRAAIGSVDMPIEPDVFEHAWSATVQGTIPGLSSRERDALLWLEWADWLGAGIGLIRQGPGATVDGSSMVDHVNRCPEVSSSVVAVDREYAEWAFEVAVEHLEDVGAVTDGLLTPEGHAALAPGLMLAWNDADESGRGPTET